jgi:hypothetical protein
MRGGRGVFPGFVTKQKNTTAAVASIKDVLDCTARADALVSGVLDPVMAQRRAAGTALDYVRALSRQVAGNCWSMSEKAGHEGPHRMQALLRSYKWSWEKARAALPALAAACLADDPDDLIGPGVAFDETADLKKGSFTACVSPQHAGVTGKVENCVTWVFAALVTASGQAWADFGMYMPDCWAKDPGRRRKAGIPDSVTFATKPELAIEQLKRLAASGLRFCWVAADEVYGRSGLFRETCRELALSYVMIIPCDYRVTIAAGTSPVRANGMVNDAVFERRSCGNGTKGPRYGGWAMIATARPREFLLIRRLDREKNPYTFYLCWAPEGRPASMTYLITIAGRRWPAETTFRTAKDTLSWDQSQVRTWQAMNRHTVLTALAQARAAAIRGALAGTVTLPGSPGDSPPAAPDRPRDDDAADADLDVPRGDAPLPAYAGQPCPASIPPVRLSDAESLRISSDTADYAAGLLSRARLAFRRRWSRWRRRHQARARWHHYSSRIQATAT